MPKILIIGRELVQRLLPMETCIPLMEQAFRAASDGSAVQGLRGVTQLPGPAGGVLGVMPGGLTAPPRFGAKIISILHGRAAQSHQGGIVLFDGDSYAPIAFIHAGEVTAIRTAAATAVATRVLARRDARVLAVLGTGEQAGTHIRALILLRAWDEIRIWGRSPEKAGRLAASVCGEAGCGVRATATVRECVAGAGVVCAVTASPTPIFTGDMLEPGMHLNLVGASVPSSREVDSATVMRCRMFADHAAMARTAGGEFITALQEGAVGADHLRGELGQILLGQIAGRENESDITLFKSLGMPTEDLFAADYLVTEANRQGLGITAEF